MWKRYCLQGYDVAGCLVLLFVIAPAAAMSCLNARWYYMDFINRKEKISVFRWIFRILLTIFGLSPVTRLVLEPNLQNTSFNVNRNFIFLRERRLKAVYTFASCKIATLKLCKLHSLNVALFHDAKVKTGLKPSIQSPFD